MLIYNVLKSFDIFEEEESDYGCKVVDYCDIDYV